MFRRFYSPESDPPHKIMRYWFYYSISWVFNFYLTTLVRWKWFVPQLYHFRRGISGGAALKYFYMIHRVGRRYMAVSTIKMWSELSRHKSWGCSFLVEGVTPSKTTSPTLLSTQLRLLVHTWYLTPICVYIYESFHSKCYTRSRVIYRQIDSDEYIYMSGNLYIWLDSDEYIYMSGNFHVYIYESFPSKCYTHSPENATSPTGMSNQLVRLAHTWHSTPFCVYIYDGFH